MQQRRKKLEQKHKSSYLIEIFWHSRAATELNMQSMYSKWLPVISQTWAEFLTFQAAEIVRPHTGGGKYKNDSLGAPKFIKWVVLLTWSR